MTKSVLFIATIFLVNMTNAQNHHGQHGPKKGNHGNHYNSIQSSEYHSYSQNNFNTFGCTIHYHDNHNANYNRRHFISNAELNAILFAIRDEPFSSDKMNIARQATMYKTLRAGQVIEIGRQFSFESDRLEFAKMAFNNTFDKENYYKVNSIFHFSSSKRELNKFIYGQ